MDLTKGSNQGENTEKYMTFTVPIEKQVTRMEKKLQKNISYIVQFIDTTRFMASSLSNLVNNLSEGINKIRYKFGHDDKKCKTCRIKCKYCYCFLEYTNFKDDLVEYKCLCCNRNYHKKFNEKLKKRFLNTYKYSNQDNNKFILLLRKGVYTYKYIDDWKQFNETSFPGRKIFIVT